MALPEPPDEGGAPRTMGDSPAAPARSPLRMLLLRPAVLGPLLLGVLVLLLFGDVLFSPGALLLSQRGADLSDQFLYSREFGSGQLRRGNLPLWNPHLFSGAPYLGTFQSALLYPLNLHYLVLPLHRAINVDLVLHVYLIGLFTYLWAQRRRLHPAACFVAACVVMLGGPFFLHLYAGHLSVLDTMAWAPLLFLAMDGLSERRALRWGLLGAAAVAMQILAGHPQTLFYTAVAAVVYLAAGLLAGEVRGRAALGLAGIYAGGAALGAVQLLTGIEAGAESTRGAGVAYSFTSMFSFPPENLLTLVAPDLFGGLSPGDGGYWARCYLWEMSLFAGAGGFALAAHGVLEGGRSARRYALVWAALLLLALGGHTPLLKLLHAWVPGFDRFRGPSKFILPASLMLGMLSGVGLDRLLRAPGRRRTAALLLALAVMAGSAALWVRTSPEGWARVVEAVAATGESYHPPSEFHAPEFLRKTAEAATASLLTCAALCLLLAALFRRAAAKPGTAFLIAAIAVVELCRFAGAARPTFPFAWTREPVLSGFLARHPGDYRILQLQQPNSAMATGAQNLTGYEPSSLLSRYASFIAFTQGQPQDKTRALLTFTRVHPLFRILRCRYALVPEGDGQRVVTMPDPLPRALLLYDWKLVPDRGAMLAAMEHPDFDPRRTAMLESRPDPAPVPGGPPGTVRVMRVTTDGLEIEAETPRPALLLVTDSYSRGWRAVPLPGNVQARYQVLPADMVLRAVPLAAGSHRLRLEYCPAGFRIGRWISLAAVLVFAVLWRVALRLGSRE